MAHVVYLPELQTAQAGERVVILGPEAHHAVRVKRCDVGAVLGIRNGRGLAARARVEAINKTRRGDWEVAALVEEARVVPASVPRVEVWASSPKGEHLAAMVDGLSQAGVARWVPLRAQRTVVEPREGKLERLERICEESLKQCGRAWLMEVGGSADLGDGLAMSAGVRVVVADQSGEAWSVAARGLTGAEVVRVLVGPEGGFAGEELATARAAGALVARFGPHAMRIETAAVIAGACVVMALRGA
jgi:16S rRNA (uracil1498-N3)-methyltransferase